MFEQHSTNRCYQSICLYPLCHHDQTIVIDSGHRVTLFHISQGGVFINMLSVTLLYPPDIITFTEVHRGIEAHIH